jgi:hypothetical protein
MKPKYYKNISEALPIERPDDKIVKIIDNKFAIIKPMFTDGTYDKPSIMYLHINCIHTFGKLSLIKDIIDDVLSWPNVECIMWCMDHKENGKPYHYCHYWNSYRKIKHTARRLLKALNNHDNN